MSFLGAYIAIIFLLQYSGVTPNMDRWHRRWTPIFSWKESDQRMTLLHKVLMNLADIATAQISAQLAHRFQRYGNFHCFWQILAKVPYLRNRWADLVKIWAVGISSRYIGTLWVIKVILSSNSFREKMGVHLLCHLFMFRVTSLYCMWYVVST